MGCLSTGVRVVICATLSILIVKIVSDRQQIRWHTKKLPKHDLQTCPDVLLGPEARLDWPNWVPFSEELAREVEEAEEGEGFDVVFYGDSITEQWRGSAVGTQYPSLKQTHEIFDSHFNKNYSSNVLAIAGDQVGHLWWRLMNGEILTKKQPKIAVILIGTNDLTADDCTATEEASMVAVAGIVSRVRQVLWLLRSKSPATDVILMGILPRDAHVLSGPPAYEWPNRMTNAIALANVEFQKMADADNKVHYLDCGAPYILEGGGLDANVLPDALHPNAPGMELMARCLQPHIDNLVLPPTPSEPIGAQGI